MATALVDRFSWWLRRLTHPWEAARVLAPRVISPRLRWRLQSTVATMLRRDEDDKPQADEIGPKVQRWLEAMPAHAERPLRPAVVCLPGVGGAEADHCLNVLADRGWQTVRVEALQRDQGRALAQLKKIRRERRIRAAVTVAAAESWVPFGRRLEEEHGWPVLEGSFSDWHSFVRAARSSLPKVSLLVVTYNNATMTRLCLASVRAFTAYPNTEVVLVDNASRDDTREALREAEEQDPTLRVIFNTTNRGFAAACNQAADAASGEIFCFLNNDTVVAPGWLWVLVRALRQDQRLGMVGPTSNAVGNEARVRARYESLDEMRAWAEARVWKRYGRGFSLPMLALYCAAIRREVWQEVGELDEDFGLGLFEDDDYCRRLRQAGYRLRCRSDAFVHHWQQAAFGHLASERYIDLYERNQAYYRTKKRER